MITQEQSIPTRSEAGLAARDVFYEQFNDVNFYIEDEQQENLYLELFVKLFPRIRIAQVFALRGKTNALKHAQDPANAVRAARSVYVLDKDFDDLLGHASNQANVFYLDRYSIENYVLEEDAVIQVALEAEPRAKRKQLRAKLAYREYYWSTVRNLMPLCRLFFAVQQFSLGLKNCDHKCEQFSMTGHHWRVDPGQVGTYEAEVCRRIRDAHVFASDDDFRQFLSTVFPRQGPRDANIPGKFLLGFTFHYLRSQVPLGITRLDSLTYRLARNMSRRAFRSVGTRIRVYLRSHGIVA